MNKPTPGDTVTFTDSFDQEWTGTVTDLLSSQFIIETESGKTQFCFYTDEWRIL